MLKVKAIKVSKMTSHSTSTVQMREESESGIRKWEEMWVRTRVEDGERGQQWRAMDQGRQFHRRAAATLSPRVDRLTRRTSRDRVVPYWQNSYCQFRDFVLQHSDDLRITIMVIILIPDLSKTFASQLKYCRLMCVNKTLPASLIASSYSVDFTSLASFKRTIAYIDFSDFLKVFFFLIFYCLVSLVTCHITLLFVLRAVVSAIWAFLTLETHCSHYITF